MRTLKLYSHAASPGAYCSLAPGRTVFFLALLVCIFARISAQTVTNKTAAPDLARSPERAPMGASEDPPQGSISGHVIASDGQPLAQARVSVIQVGSSGRSATSNLNPDGEFRRDNLVPGLYSVTAYLAGYVSETDGQLTDRAYYRPGDVVTIRMTKGSVITGKVSDVNGQPLVSVPVRVLNVRTLDGKSIPNLQVTERYTDDRGIYRIYGLREGVYKVSAGGAVGFGFSASAFDRDVPVYHPSSTSAGASEVILHSGEEIANIDIRYHSERGHSISGNAIIPMDTSNQPSSISVSLVSIPDSTRLSTLYLPDNQSEIGQTFELLGVPDGEYFLTASRYSPLNPASTFAKVTVKGADIRGLILKLSAMASIEGRLVVQQSGSAQCRTQGTLPQEFFVSSNAERSSTEERKTFPNFGNSGAGFPDPKGDFKVNNLYSGTYRLRLRFPSEQWFLKSVEGRPASATTGGKNDKAIASAGVPTDSLVLSAGEHKAGIRITAAAGGGTFRGRVEPELKGGAISHRILVTAVPADVEKQKDALRFAETFMRPDHTFELKNLAPGNYFIVARTVSEAVFADPNRDPSFNSSKDRLELIRIAAAAKTAFELKECQTTSDLVIHPSQAPK